jgi:dihydropteroate synthase
MKPAVMRAAVDAGCAMVNDVNGFRAEGAIAAVAGSGVALCAMHMKGSPATMQADPRYDDVVGEVREYLLGRARALEEAGVHRERIALDPGFGFGKNFAHNAALLAGLGELAATGYPVVAGLSRKRMIGEITGRPVGERVAGSVAAALLAVQNGARIVRVHDVRETADALKVWRALTPGPSPGGRGERSLCDRFADGQPSTLVQRLLRCGQTRNRDAARAAADVIEADGVAEEHAGRVAAVFAADADFQVLA